MNTPTKFKADNRKTADNKLYIQYCIGLGVYLIYYFTEQDIINTPDMIYLYIFIAVVIISEYLRFNKQREAFNQEPDPVVKAGALGLNILNMLIVSYFIAGIVLIPFNVIDLYIAKKNDVESYKCEFRGINRSGSILNLPWKKEFKIWFKIDGKMSYVNAGAQEAEKLNLTGRDSQYRFILYARPGLLNTLIAERWEIENK